MDRRELIAGAVAGAAALGTKAADAAPMRGFPKGFQWGVATAAHQVEGNNVNSDFWLMENLKGSPFREPSGDACDSYHRWADDVAIIAALGLSTYRFSIEWARIEPEPGRYSQAEIDHYRRLIEACRAKGIRPLATFHHFTSPRWLAAMGGWGDAATPDRFAAYSARLVKDLGDGLDGVCTINEPNGPVEEFCLRGDKPVPGEALFSMLAAKAAGSTQFSTYGLGDALKNRDGMIEGHKRARAAIKAQRASLSVGITLALTELSAEAGGEALYRHTFDVSRKPFYEAAKGDDFVGVQNYGRALWSDTGKLPLPNGGDAGGYNSEFYPASLAGAVRYAHAASGVPVIVTEHGVGTDDDTIRARLIPAALADLYQLIAEGVPVKGYMHWSLIDNFEWVLGFKMKYGLCSVNRTTFERAPKPSAAVYGAIARANAV